MTDKSKLDILTLDHLSRFGSIVHSFARLEYLIQSTMAAVAELEDTKIVLLTKSLTYSQKRDTLYSYLEFYRVSAARQAEIRNFLDRAHKHNALRNNIAHALWLEGSLPGTIRAGYIDVRFGRGKIVGYGEDDADYSVDELGNIANELRSIVNNLIRFLRDSGMSADIAKKIEETNKSI